MWFAIVFIFILWEVQISDVLSKESVITLEVLRLMFSVYLLLG